MVSGPYSLELRRRDPTSNQNANSLGPMAGLETTKWGSAVRKAELEKIWPDRTMFWRMRMIGKERKSNSRHLSQKAGMLYVKSG